MDSYLSKESFLSLAKSKGFKSNTIEVLVAEDYDSLYVLSTMEEEDLEALDITRGQKSLLRKWVKELKSSAPRVPIVTEEDDRSNTFRKLATDRGVKENTICVLLEEDYDTLFVLSHMEEKDLNGLKITIGQKSLLRQWVKELKACAPRLKLVAEQMASLQVQLPNPSISPTLPSKSAATLKPPSKFSKKHTRKRSLPSSLNNDSKAAGSSHGAAAKGWLPDVAKGWLPERQPGDGGDPLTSRGTSEGFCWEVDKADLAITPENITECLKQLDLNEEAEEEVRKHVLEKGVDGLDSCLKEKLANFMKCPVSIAVAGRAGTGKSSLINSLRKVKARTEYAAPVGNTETTKEITPYAFPQMQNTKLFDLPGVNTPLFPKESYLEKVRFKSYDAIIIVGTERFTEDDLWLANEAHQGNKPFYYLRTKIDLDIQNSKENDGIDDEQFVLDKVRNQILKSFETAHLPNERVFLISNVYGNQSKWDYPKLCQDLLDKAPERNKYAMVMAMVSCSKDVILMKKRELANRIDMVVLGTLVNCTQYDKVLQGEIKLYTERLGITQADLDEVSSVNFDDRIQDIIHTLESILNEPMDECKIGRKVGIWFFGIGYFIGKWIDEAVTKEKHRRIKLRREEVIQEARMILTTVLEKCVDLALVVLDAQKYLESPS